MRSIRVLFAIICIQYVDLGLHLGITDILCGVIIDDMYNDGDRDQGGDDLPRVLPDRVGAGEISLPAGEDWLVVGGERVDEQAVGAGVDDDEIAGSADGDDRLRAGGQHAGVAVLIDGRVGAPSLVLVVSPINDDLVLLAEDKLVVPPRQIARRIEPVVGFNDWIKATGDCVEILQRFRQLISGPRLSVVEFPFGVTIVRREWTTEERLNDTMSIPPEDLRVRRMVAITLGRMRAKETLPSLRRHFPDGEPSPNMVNNACGWAIGQITGEAMPPPRTFEGKYQDWFLVPAY